MLRQGSLKPQVTTTEYLELVAVALDVAREAGALVSQGYRTRPVASEKAARDLVPEFDLASERLIRERLGQATPSIPVVAEETGGSPGERTWYCDPLDGTMNFVHGHPYWSVSIGLYEAGVPSVGVVVAPILGLAWTGHRGGVSRRVGEPCAVSATQSLGSALVATGFPPEREREPDSNLGTFVDVMGHVQGVRRCGSAAIDLCLVADGTYDGYWERRLSAWDVCGGACIVLGAGGRLTSLDGTAADITRGHLLATNGLIHEAMLEILAKHG